VDKSPIITITMSRLFEKFSSKENLKKAYQYIQDEIVHSSLSVNPINHPSTTAINDIGDNFFSALEQHIRKGDYKPERGFFVYIPKDNLGLRPVCILSMVDRIVYQAIFNQDVLGYKIDGQLSDTLCFANRINDDENQKKFLSTYFNGWDDFCKEQKKAFKKSFTWKIEVDVQQYYEHIPIDRLIEKIKTDFEVKDDDILNILKSQLCIWAEYPELPKGIPQGPEASAILGNAYLSSLDRFAEKELTGKSLRYFRYADDITIMGKTKEDVLRATEKVVHFLRGHNLTLNEKTKLAELENDESIEAMRFFSIYDEDTPEIPEDNFAIVQRNAPYIISSIQKGEKVEKENLRELKYFLKVDTSYDVSTMIDLIELIPLRPSLTTPIVQYVSEGRNFLSILGDEIEIMIIDFRLWETYSRTDISEWSRFWIFKLLVSNKDVVAGDIEKEVNNILASKDNSIFKIASLYYKAIQGKDIDIGQIRTAIEGSKSDVEKSLYSFFLLNAFQKQRVSVVKNHIERLLNSTSHELNLIGSYLFKNKSKVPVDDFDGVFSCLLLKKKQTKKPKGKSQQGTSKNTDLYMIRSENLIPISSPSEILGVSRPQKKKGSVEINISEAIQWEKLELKIKDGLQDIEIFYDNEHIITTNYIDLGFSATKKEHRPDRKWNFLCILSVLQNEDITQATPNNLMTMLARYSGKAIRIANVHQTKRLLSKALRVIFKTSDDPFYENRVYYHPKFIILPEAVLRSKEIWRQGGHLNENVDYEE